MSRLATIERSNSYLFDLLFRHQVYLEGVKVGFAGLFKKMLTELYSEFAKYVGMQRYTNMDAFTRYELQQFIRRFQEAQTRSYNQYTNQLILLLKQFLAADVDVTNAIYGAVTGQPKTAAGTESSNDHLWATISSEIVPANGLTIGSMLQSFTTNSVGKISAELSKGYANSNSFQDTFAAMTGERSNNYRDGLFALFNNQNNALLATILQYVSSLVQNSIAVVHFPQDQWVSILDSHTTEICRSRNGNVYPSDEGPFPPAHYQCRSKRIPLTQGDELHDIPPTFYDWLVDQPTEFVNDALGASIAAKIASGSNSARDISVNDLVLPLTLTQFRSKINLILL